MVNASPFVLASLFFTAVLARSPHYARGAPHDALYPRSGKGHPDVDYQALAKRDVSAQAKRRMQRRARCGVKTSTSSLIVATSTSVVVNATSSIVVATSTSVSVKTTTVAIGNVVLEPHTTSSSAAPHTTSTSTVEETTTTKAAPSTTTVKAAPLVEVTPHVSAPPPTTKAEATTSAPPPPPPPAPTTTSTKARPTTTSVAPPPATSQPSSGGGGGGGLLSGSKSGQGTFYETGLGACGITNNDGDFIAAASHTLFDEFPGYNGENPNNNPMCGRKVVASYQGKSITVSLTDRCAGCAPWDLDFSPAAFKALANPDAGRIDITWVFA